MKEVLEFLSALKKNNNREWFDEHKSEYVNSKEIFEQFVREVARELSIIDPTLAGTDAKKAIYRIYRDVRFSKNKKPYKENMGAFIARGGRKSGYAGYYMHVEPGGNSIVAGGLYRPEPDVLSSVRQEIDYSAPQLKSILEKKEFREFYGEMQGEKLKTSPRDYPADHPEIALLRHKSFIMVHHVPDAKVKTKEFQDYVVKGFQILQPFINFLNTPIEEIKN